MRAAMLEATTERYPETQQWGGDRAGLVCWSKDLKWEKVISHGRFCKKILRKAINNVSGIQMLPKYVVPILVTPLLL